MKNVALGGAHTPESISADEEPTLMNDAQPCFLARCRERVESAASTSFSGDGSVAPIVLWLIIGLAAVLRFAYLGAKSIWSDEAFSIVMAQLPWSDFWRMTTTTEANMSLYYVLLRGWLRFGDPAWWVKLLSALTAVAVVPIVYWIGRELFSHRAGALAALLLSINVFHIRYSQEARSYSLVVLLVAFSFLAFFRCLKEPDHLWGGFYVLSTALALYAHFFAALVLLAQLVSLAAMPNPRRFATRQLARLCLVLILGSPLLWFVLFRNRGQLNWIQPIHLKDLYHFLLYMTGSGLKFGIALVAILVALRTWVSRWRTQQWDMEAWSFVVLILWLALPLCVAMVVSIWKPIYAPRFLIFCLPAALLLIADGLAQISYPWIRYALVTLLLVSAVGPIRSYYVEPGQEDWRNAVDFIARNVSAGDTAYLPNAYCGLPLNYQLGHSRMVVPSLRIVSSITPEALPERGTGHIWMITCSTTTNFNAQPAIGNYEVQEVRLFRGIRVIRLGRKPQE
jgi:4-amino-4-deoxy-L-arabinose transferase-like glycosyltransferase